MPVEKGVIKFGYGDVVKARRESSELGELTICAVKKNKGVVGLKPQSDDIDHRKRAITMTSTEYGWKYLLHKVLLVNEENCTVYFTDDLMLDFSNFNQLSVYVVADWILQTIIEMRLKESKVNSDAD